MTTHADRTLDSQHIIREMAGLLSTFGHHARHHPEECIPEAEALYDAFFTAQAREIERLREGLDLSWEEAINAVPGRCEGLSVCEPMCHDNIQADLRAARAAGTP